MGKKVPDPSLKGKKPVNTSGKGALAKNTVVTRNPSFVKNKIKRGAIYAKYVQTKKLEKKKARIRRQKEVEELGEEHVKPKQTPRTLDNTREVEPTMVQRMDEEVAADEADDEFAAYYNFHTTTTIPNSSEQQQEQKQTDDEEKKMDGESIRPKVLITTRPKPSRKLYYFIADLQKLIPALYFYPRKEYSIKEICTFASNRNFTHLIVLSEKSKVCNGMTISHLKSHPNTGLAGPTAFFKVSNVITANDIPNRGKKTNHVPELNIHGFRTRLGHRIGRFLGSLFPHVDTQVQGRQVVTFHNQRDYVFVRQHRYIFNEQTNNKVIEYNRKQADRAMPHVKARLQELGPRFTLKLRWLQEGTFDTMFGEYEFIHKRKEMDVSRRKFHL